MLLYLSFCPCDVDFGVLFPTSPTAHDSEFAARSQRRSTERGEVLETLELRPFSGGPRYW